MLAAFIYLEQIVQEILSAPPSQCMPDKARADILSMTLKQLLLQRRWEVKLSALTWGSNFA